MTLNLGENIKKYRLDRNLTQEEIADFLGVTFQSVSRWERGESYPDITLLPEIATFFKVSVDELLGVNKAVGEEEIKRLLKDHDNLTDEKLIWESINHLREKYPNDFRVQLRYMGNLIFYNKLEGNKGKIESLYENIQKNCTVDSIRICAKRYYIYYMQMLSAKPDSGVTFEDYEKIIKEMPRMRDGREIYAGSYKIHNRPDCDEIMQESIEETISILYDMLSNYYFRGDKFNREFQIEIVEKTKDFFNYIYDDGHYSRMWRVVMNCCYGLLGWFYHQRGDDEKAIENLKKSAELAVQFDKLDEISVMHSRLFEGKHFDKKTLGSTFIAKSWMKEHITNQYPLSEEFKQRDEFKEIVDMLS